MLSNTKPRKYDHGVALLRVAAPMRRYHSTEEHLGLGYLTSYLRYHGANCMLLDMPAMNITAEEALKQLLVVRPTLIGFTLDYANEYATGQFIEQVRIRLSESICFAGGHHATLAAEALFMRHPGLDAIVLGEGEKTLHQMWDTCNQGKSLQIVPGLLLRTINGVLHTSVNTILPEVSSLPHPARDSLRSQLLRGEQRVARVISARGCPGRCSFCSSPSFFAIQGQGLWRPREPEDIVNEIETLYKELSIRLIIFSEDNSLGWGQEGHLRFIRIAELLQERNLHVKFRIMGRIDNFKGTPEDEQFLIKLKNAGLQRIYFGFDGGTTSSLKTYDKDIHLKNVFNTKRLLDRLNISIGVGFINFNPYSTIKELLSNGHFLESTGFGVNFDHYASSLELYPGVKIISRLEKDGLLDGVDPETGLHRFRFREIRLKSLLQFMEELRGELFEVDSFAWRLLHMKQNLREWLEDINEPNPIYTSHRVAVKHCLESLNACHGKAYRDYLDLFSVDSNECNLRQRGAKHIEEARSIVLGFDFALSNIDLLLLRKYDEGKYDQREIVKWLLDAMRKLSSSIRTISSRGLT